MICQNCNQEMVLQKKFDTKPRGKMKTKYRTLQNMKITPIPLADEINTK